MWTWFWLIPLGDDWCHFWISHNFDHGQSDASKERNRHFFEVITFLSNNQKNQHFLHVTNPMAWSQHILMLRTSFYELDCSFRLMCPHSLSATRFTVPSGRTISHVMLPFVNPNLDQASGGSCKALQEIMSSIVRVLGKPNRNS